MKMSIEELGDELCKHCPCTDYGREQVNTAPYNLCEGRRCEEAYENYLDEEDDEK